jgi:hypothetical protein
MTTTAVIAPSTIWKKEEVQIGPMDLADGLMGRKNCTGLGNAEINSLYYKK